MALTLAVWSTTTPRQEHNGLVRAGTLKSLIALSFSFTFFISSTCFAQTPVQEPGGQPGVVSPGSPGMEELGEPAFLAPANTARQKYGEKSVQYMRSLLDLGMYYNRHDRSSDAVRVLTKSLALADSGLLARLAPKAVPGKIASKPKVTISADGATVSVENNDPQAADTQFLEGLLPALAEAEMNIKMYPAAEVHLRRLIGVAQSGRVEDKVTLMSAYWQYAELMRRTNRKAQAQEYQKKGDAINNSFVPL